MGLARARIAVLMLLCALGAGVAQATPPARPPSASSDPAMVAAEAAWHAAETTRDPVDAPAAWEAAAMAFGRAAEAASGPDQAEARYAAVLAWRNALNVAPRARAAADVAAPPSPTLTPREVALVAAIDAYLPQARTDEVAELMFVRAMVFHRHARHADVVPAMAAIVTGHADAEVAEYAANLLLDALNQEAKYDEMLAWVVRMRADRTLLAGRAALAHTLDALHVQGLRKRAEEAEASHDAVGFTRCAAIYEQILRDVARPDRADELLYNGGVCAEQAGAIADARARYQRLLKRFPRSSLAAATRGRLKALRGR